MKTREEILQMVENEDVEFIRLQFTDMFGTLKNVAVTATQLQYMKDNRYLIDGSCMYLSLIHIWCIPGLQRQDIPHPV